MQRHLMVMWLLVVAVLVACSAPAVTPTAAPMAGQPSPTAATRPTLQPASGPLAGQLAELGKVVFAKSCSCHGANGEGRNAPALVGSSAKLDKYGTAQGLLQFITQSMPLGAKGSLKSDDYLNIVSFLLVDNKVVSADNAIDVAALAGISLKK
jgi:mono/diheme cytochrome c family protein